MLDRRWAHVVVPTCDGGRERVRKQYIAQLLGVVRRLDEDNPEGWVIDLRNNLGGDMWPMLAGIGPVLGEGELGAFVEPGGEKKKWYYRDGKALLDKAGPPVAVLTGGKTISSGEAIAIAFRGRPRTRSFGQPTAGLSTANEEFPLSDGARLCLTVATFADRTGKVYGAAVEPDEKIAAGGKEDVALKAALAWLKKQLER
jgi:C-terminal processing protease CtpA/Prc